MTQVSSRAELRQRRRQLSLQQQTLAARDFTRQLCRLPQFICAHRVTFYIANDGELDVEMAMTIAECAGKACYLPVLHPLQQNSLHFVRYRSRQSLIPNRFGIPEPPLKQAQCAPAWSMNIILLPLVGFDSNCNRLGMGGGFYDRTLAFKKRNRSKSPLLIGVAHHCQQMEAITPQPWDIPLDMVITDQQIFHAPPDTLEPSE